MAPPAPPSAPHGRPEVYAPRRASVGSGEVARSLPQRARRTVGHWCFVDLFTPGVGTAASTGMGVGPHPHCGLHTVTWLTSGAVHHTDSLGSSQPVEPGQLNLMTAGAGITHAEAAVPGSDPVFGAQLWLAQPDATRHGPPRFAHHADLPQLAVGPGLDATVAVGSVGDVASPAEVDTDALCLSITSTGGGSGALELAPSREHAVVVLDGHAALAGAWPDGDEPLAPGALAVLDPGHGEVDLRVGPDTTLLVLGGEPTTERLVMWWNFVVRSTDEAHEASEAWNGGDARFGPQPPSPDPRQTAPLPPGRRPAG